MMVRFMAESRPSSDARGAHLCVFFAQGDVAGSWELLDCRETAGKYVGSGMLARGGTGIRKSVSDVNQH
jgi:hypothetical protein